MSQVTEFDRLMAEVAAGSEDAALQLAEKYTPYIIRSVRRRLGSKIRQKLDSQDVAQTLWASLLLRRTDLLRLKTPEQLIAYLMQATKNKVAEKTRLLHRQKCDISRESPLDTEVQTSANTRNPTCRALHSREQTPSSHASFRERWQNVMLNASERDRQIMTLRFKQHTFEEISSMLSIHEQTARRAVQKLVEQLAD